jgi:hypothetical protein
MANIVVFVDGTHNEAIHERIGQHTNVRKLHAEVRKHGRAEHMKYIRGVGIARRQAHRALPRPASPPNLAAALGNALRVARLAAYAGRLAGEKFEHVVGGALGSGAVDRIREAYAYISRHYRPGDRIYLFGFSRGAFIARLVAGFIDQVGLVLRDYATGPDRRRLVERACWLYLVDPQADRGDMRNFLRHVTGASDVPEGKNLPIHVVGVWDTVAAIHSAERVSWNAKRVKVDLRKKYSEAQSLPRAIAHARHALAIHELRSKFEPLLWSAFGQWQTLEQAWFAGAHSDVGGSYPETGLSDVALDWMMDEIARLDPSDGLVPLPAARSLKLQSPHHEIGVLFPFARVRQFLESGRIAARLAGRHHFHPSAASYLLDGAARKYDAYPYANKPAENYPGSVAQTLRAIDGLYLRRYLELCYESDDIPSIMATAATSDPIDLVSMTTEYFAGRRVTSRQMEQQCAGALAVRSLLDQKAIVSVHDRFVDDHRAVIGAYEKALDRSVLVRWQERVRSLKAVLHDCQAVLPPKWSGRAQWESKAAAFRSNLLDSSDAEMTRRLIKPMSLSVRFPK